jgi:hypothetical protein
LQVKRLTDQVAQLQKIIQQDDMKLMMMDFANTTQAELEAERGELQVIEESTFVYFYLMRALHRPNFRWLKQNWRSCA